MLIRFIEKKDLQVLGLLPNRRYSILFFIGLVGFMLLNAAIIYLDSKLTMGNWIQNPQIEGIHLLKSFWYHLSSAIFEELIFRGAILYLMVSILSAKWGLIISAVAFGVYHWFSYGFFGRNIVLMLYVLFITGSMGYVWSLAYIKTKSLLLVLGMLLGWNFTTTLFAEVQPYGQLLFYSINNQDIMNEWLNLIYQIVKGILPAIITYIAVIQYFKKCDQSNKLSKLNLK